MILRIFFLLRASEKKNLYFVLHTARFDVCGL